MITAEQLAEELKGTGPGASPMETWPTDVFSKEVLPKLGSWWEDARPPGLLQEHLPYYAKPYAVALEWARAMVTNEGSDGRRALVERELQRVGVPAPEPSEVEHWANEFPDELRAVLAEVGLEEVTPEELYQPKSEEGLFWLAGDVPPVLGVAGEFPVALWLSFRQDKDETTHKKHPPVPGLSPKAKPATGGKRNERLPRPTKGRNDSDFS